MNVVPLTDRRRALVAAVIATTLLAVAPSPVVRGEGSAGLRVAAFRVADDLTRASIVLAGARDVAVTGPTGALPVRDGTVTVPLSFSGDQIQKIALQISGAGQAARASIEYYPSAYYERIGSDLPGIVLLDTTVPRAGDVTIGVGVADGPTPVDRDSPTRARWDAERQAGLVPTIGADRDGAVLALYRTLAATNDPSVGRLCSDQASGIDTLDGLRDHDCFVWCTGFARILRGFLRSADVPARMIYLKPQQTRLSNGVLATSSEAHATDEIWDGDHWAWIGPTYRVLRATDASGRSLSVAEMMRAVADPATRESVRFTRLDPATGTWRTAPLSAQDADLQQHLTRDFSLDKTISVVGAPAGAPPALILALLVIAIGSLAVSAATMWRRRRAASVRA